MRATTAIVIAALGLAAGCKETVVPDLNNPSLEGVTNDPTRPQVQSLATGLLMGNRGATGAFIRDLEIIGRDAYNLDPADPRWITELLVNLDPGGFGAAHWGVRYRNVKGANIMVSAVQSATVLSAAEKSAAMGFARTIKALDLLAVIEARDTVGIAVDAGSTPDALAPIACRAPALARIAALLDSARTDLLAGGTAFPFTLTPGFAGFDTPGSFLRFNRGLKGKVEIYRAKTDPTRYSQALTDLAASFVDTTASLDLGVYHFFSLAAGDQANPLYQDPATANFRAHPSVRTDAEAGDRRVAAKTAIGPSKTYQGVTSNILFTRYANPTAPIPIMRNEELILLRAQANLGANNLPEASRDINVIRRRSGGLPNNFHATAAAALDDLLRQKRYSLLWESPSRWVDARLYGRLGTLPRDAATHKVHATYEIPQAEVLARGGSATCTP